MLIELFSPFFIFIFISIARSLSLYRSHDNCTDVLDWYYHWVKWIELSWHTHTHTLIHEFNFQYVLFVKSCIQLNYLFRLTAAFVNGKLVVCKLIVSSLIERESISYAHFYLCCACAFVRIFRPTQWFVVHSSPFLCFCFWFMRPCWLSIKAIAFFMFEIGTVWTISPCQKWHAHFDRRGSEFSTIHLWQLC